MMKAWECDSQAHNAGPVPRDSWRNVAAANRLHGVWSVSCQAAPCKLDQVVCTAFFERQAFGSEALPPAVPDVVMLDGARVPHIERLLAEPAGGNDD